MKAIEYFYTGYNCAQSVFVPLSKDYFQDEKLALRIMSPFGGGVSNTDNICGAVIGALAALGLTFGHSDADDKEGKLASKKISQRFMQEFKKEHGSIKCSDLIGHNLSQAGQVEKAQEANAFETICPKFVESAEVLVKKIVKGEI